MLFTSIALALWERTDGRAALHGVGFGIAHIAWHGIASHAHLTTRLRYEDHHEQIYPKHQAVSEYFSIVIS